MMTRLLKRMMPRGLFGRWLLLLVLPVVLLQIFSAYIFYERHWDAVSRRLALGVAGEIATLIDLRRVDPELWESGRLGIVAATHMQLDARFERDAQLPQIAPRLRRFSILDQMLNQALSERINYVYQIDTQRPDELIEVRIQLEDGVLRVFTQEKRLFSSTTYIFFLWMAGGSLVLIAVALLFLRNQVRPIRRLALAAEAFGKGQDIEDFRPSGAIEVRRAAAAFIAMRQRIKKFIRQRTHMLAGVSHDLRTPLTRMKLQLALMPHSEAVDDLARDIEAMQRMIDGYLAFVRGEEGEDPVSADLCLLLKDVIARNGWTETQIKFHLADAPIPIQARLGSLSRAFANVLENAIKYGGRAEISASLTPAGARGRQVEITIDDEGPGIPAALRTRVFQPFVRLDEARNPDIEGVGLGLAIARDAINAHGGGIELGNSPKGGLRVIIRLPL